MITVENVFSNNVNFEHFNEMSKEQKFDLYVKIGADATNSDMDHVSDFFSKLEMNDKIGFVHFVCSTAMRHNDYKHDMYECIFLSKTFEDLKSFAYSNKDTFEMMMSECLQYHKKLLTGK